MVDIRTLPDVMQKNLNELDCPVFENKPWVRGVPLKERRVAMLSSAGLHLRSDQHFVGGDHCYRVIPNDTAPDDIVMSHISVNFDRCEQSLFIYGGNRSSGYGRRCPTLGRCT